MTEIDMLPDDPEASTSEHTLQAVAAMSGIGVTQQIPNSLFYFCSTDRCNDANQFKRILESLTLTNQFTELEDLLRPTLPFVGQWCLLYANRSDEGCNSPVGIDPNDCKQCSSIFTDGNTMNTIYASCFTDDIHEAYLAREVLFNISDRAIIDRWAIYCRSENCNGLSTGQRINEKSIITFDFNKFLSNNASSKQTMSLFLLKIAFIFLTCIIKTFY